MVDLRVWPAVLAAGLCLTLHQHRGRYPVPVPEPAVPTEGQARRWLLDHTGTVAAYARRLYALGYFERAWHLVNGLWPVWLLRKDYALRLELDLLAWHCACR
ncbi:hypothetical protein JOF41_000891 [Saccharothrix coeruleofusca]|nr:hypothetical protein [Saccharothrix coeruleofusca]MBP2334713.1 hypothetical protein [Saccharothrix coeruleofusca]